MNPQIDLCTVLAAAMTSKSQNSHRLHLGIKSNELHAFFLLNKRQGKIGSAV